MTMLPAIPEPSSTPVPALLDACEAVVMWAEECDDLPLVEDIYERMADVVRWLSRNDHALAAQASLRRLEERIGQLLGPAEVGGDRGNQYTGGKSQIPHAEPATSLPPNRASEFRKIAAHPEVVDEVIAEATEDSPPSRRKVLEAIKSLEQAAKDAHRAEVDEQKAWAKSITPDDYDPAEDERSATIQRAILSAERGVAALAAYTLDEVLSALDHSNPRVRDVVYPTYTAKLRYVVETIEAFRGIA